MKRVDELQSLGNSAGSEKERARARERSKKIVASFNTWAFKREHPSDVDLLMDTVARFVQNLNSLSFILYWGKGPRETIAPPDLACMDFLQKLNARVKNTYSPGVEFTLCLTDSHARLNGHSEASIDAYFAAVSDAAQARGMLSVRLSDLVGSVKGEVTDISALDRELISQLKRSAEKWYRGTGSPEDGARKYLAMNMIERQAISEHYNDSVFVTFNGSDCRALFPAEMPIFYMYSLRRGTSTKPWFMDPEGIPYAGATAEAA